MINVITAVSMDETAFHRHDLRINHVSVPDGNDLSKKADANSLNSYANEVSQLKTRLSREMEAVGTKFNEHQRNLAEARSNFTSTQEQCIEQFNKVIKVHESQLREVRDGIHSGQWQEAAFKNIKGLITEAERSLDKTLGELNTHLKLIQSERATIEKAKGEIEILVMRIDKDVGSTQAQFIQSVTENRSELEFLQNGVRDVASTWLPLQQEITKFPVIGFWGRLKWLLFGTLAETPRE